MTYAPHGAISTLPLGSGLSESWRYNPRLQTNSIRLGGALTLGYAYGASNRFRRPARPSGRQSNSERSAGPGVVHPLRVVPASYLAAQPRRVARPETEEAPLAPPCVVRRFLNSGLNAVQINFSIDAAPAFEPKFVKSFRVNCPQNPQRGELRSRAGYSCA